MRPLLWGCAVILAVLLAGCQPKEEWELVWSDEFDGGSINPSNWTYDRGGLGWGNNELQAYTDKPENAYVQDGSLVIEARPEFYERAEYTSARLKTYGLRTFTYGRFEARIRVPRGQGIWPAFWLLGQDLHEVGWPESGEIDVMEHIGSEPDTIHGTLHGPGYSGDYSHGGTYVLKNGAFADDYHVFAVEWLEDEIRWEVDGEQYHRVRKSDLQGKDWVFNKPFYLVLNIAVGGEWPGPPDASTQFPQYMFVDYVRVYQLKQ